MRKLRVKIKQRSRRQRVKIRYLVSAAALMLVALPHGTAQAVNCPDVRVVFARGSGSPQNTDQNFLTFKSEIEERLKTTTLEYDFVDLDYPAIGVGIDNLGVTLGALFGGGEAYAFGDSIASGSRKLVQMVNNETCANTRYVLGGYSQGAIVISKSLPSLDADRIIYAATFGDPKLYLPEGKGLFPAACFNQNLSDYRRYVPDCQTYEGLLGGYQPYEPSEFVGKLGTWCNRHDFFCSPIRDMSAHTAYVSDNLYEDAAKVIFDKINRYFALGSRVATAHDTAILIDSTDSMDAMIHDFKAEAVRLATETFKAGGRVALYDYRDLEEGYEPVQRCDFDTCTLQNFQSKLDEIYTDGGADLDESMLSAAFKAMHELKWRQGATKSLVVLTDAGFLSPDRDGTTFADVVKLSREIDPVNFYVVTKPAVADRYAELAEQTDGLVVSNMNELHLLTDYILDRYDSLPRVEEAAPTDLPELSVTATEKLNDGSVRVEFTTTGTETLVALNDAILGATAETTLTINELDWTKANTLTLVPMTATLRGAAVSVELDAVQNVISDATDDTTRNTASGLAAKNDADGAPFVFLKAPDTGIPH